jgi:hypothetical protein
MDRPKWGTCWTTDGCSDGCRWARGMKLSRVDDTPAEEDVLGCLRLLPKRYGLLGSAFAKTAPNWTCCEWEPPEGRCCGTCEAFAVPGDDGFGYCAIRFRGLDAEPMVKEDRHERDTCGAWRWNGGE